MTTNPRAEAVMFAQQQMCMHLNRITSIISMLRDARGAPVSPVFFSACVDEMLSHGERAAGQGQFAAEQITKLMETPDVEGIADATHEATDDDDRGDCAAADLAAGSAELDDSAGGGSGGIFEAADLEPGDRQGGKAVS